METLKEHLRKLTEESVKVKLKPIFGKIEDLMLETAKKGEYFIKISIPYYYEKDIKDHFTSLRVSKLADEKPVDYIKFFNEPDKILNTIVIRIDWYN